MKELSIEEKAKAYDEAKRRGLDYIRLTPATELVTRQSILEHIFPELAESEDEKIRKELIDYLKERKSCESYGQYVVRYDRWIAWLEKQGEHANFRNKIQVGDKVTRNEDGVLVNLSQLNRVAKKDEKQGEQNPAWSEEDKDTIEKAICVLEANFEPSEGFSGLDIKRCQLVDRLKSLKDRTQPQPKQEWTMQDEEELQIALDTLVKAGQHSSAKWLKNVCLVPQKHWKPSDEQMEALDDFIYAKYPNVEKHGAAVKSLYQDLKKLREE